MDVSLIGLKALHNSLSTALYQVAGGVGGSGLGNRNTPSTTTVTLSDQQIQKIANAVREGASKATINLDGDRVSSRLQTPMVINTLPGV